MNASDHNVSAEYKRFSFSRSKWHIYNLKDNKDRMKDTS